MKIAMFLDAVFPPDPRVENEAVSLIREGHEVYLFSLNYDNRSSFEEIRGIKVLRYKANKLIYKLSALAYTVPLYHFLIYNKISDFINEVNPDVLHVHDMIIARAVFWANRKRKLPVVLDLHENRPVIMREYPHLKRFPGKYIINLQTWEKKQRELMAAADRIILVTKEAKDEAVSYGMFGEEKIVVVPNTIHLDIFRSYPVNHEILNRFNDTFNLVYVGDTALRRGIDTAIKAISILIDKIPEIRLILIGTSTEDIVSKIMVEELQIHEYVIFEGWQDISLFPSYLKAADICISPLKRNLHHDTTYANKIFQYMAMGKPIIVSDCPAQEHVVEKENCGLVHRAGDEKDLAEKVLMLYNDPHRRAALGKNGLEAVEQRWNWNITKRQLIHLYEKIL